MKRVAQILVAGVGNIFLRDDGFGGEVIKRLEDMQLPEGMRVLDFGTGGLELAYEVMRGYDALILVDVSRQGGEPGTLYLMEVDEQSIDGRIEDEQPLDPHAMDPQGVLRFVRYVGGWPGQVMVIACEPELVGEIGMGLTKSVEGVLDEAVKLVLETAAELQAAVA